MNPLDLQVKIDNLVRRNPAYQGIVTWLGGLLAETMSPGAGPPMWDAPESAAEPAPGRPLIHLEDLPLDMGSVAGLWLRLVERTGQQAGENAQIDRLRHLPEEPRALRNLAAALLGGDADGMEREARRWQVDSDLLGLLTRLALRPSLLALAAWAAPELENRLWDRGYCPVCGSEPALASLGRDSGQRRLHCSMCETAWAYARLGCPFCGQSDPAKLSYLRAEGEEGLRVDICHGCGRHLKTLDIRGLAEPVVVPLDDAATLHLDLMAQQYSV